MLIRFAKAHGAMNDFLLSWAEEVGPLEQPVLERIAVAICNRHTGIGADGWLLLARPGGGEPARLRLFNPDGGEVEMSGNGTRCAAALLVEQNLAAGDLTIVTGAGAKHLHLRDRQGQTFLFEMNMGKPVVEPGEPRQTIALGSGAVDATLIDVGNPQCAVFVEGEFPADWRDIGAALERHPRFPKRTNVSFARVLGEHEIEVRFFERGVGETMSSGTGSTGAAAAAILRGAVRSPVTIRTPAGVLDYRQEPDGDAYLTGPAEIVGRGEFYTP